MRAALDFALVVLLALAAPPAPSGQTVLVELKDGTKQRAQRIRTEPPSTLVLDLPGAREQRIPLAQITAIRFKRMLPWRDMLQAIRLRPFVGAEFEGLSRLAVEEKAQRAATLFQRLQQEKDPARRMRQALNLAALRFGREDFNGCREALRLLKAAAKEAGDRKAYDETCVRLAALQLPDQEACDAELLSDILGRQQEADVEQRVPVIARLAEAAAGNRR